MKHLLILPFASLAAAGPTSYSIEKDDAPGVFVSVSDAPKREIGVGIFQVRTGQPYLQLLDRDGDGVFDLLTYSC